MTPSESVAQRYAQALLAIAADQKKEQEFFRNGEQFSQLLESSRELIIALSHPNITRQERHAVLSAVLAKFNFDRLFQNFIRLLVDRSRIVYFVAIHKVYASMLDEALGRQRGKVFAAQALSFSQRETLKNKLKAQLNCDVILSEIIEPDLIGGLRVEIAGRVYDNTLRRHLEKIREGIGLNS